MKNGNADSLYYVYTDYLGSWEVVTDESGAFTERMYYDAWGSRVDSVGAPIPSTKSFTFDRGFTGHEHHDVFCLINMNGRMYDPVVGVMLSPDRFMTDPLQTDDYNLFAYAWNNPLKYTDPSGWWEDWFGVLQADGTYSDVHWADAKVDKFKAGGETYTNLGTEIYFTKKDGQLVYGDDEGNLTDISTLPVSIKPANPAVRDGDPGDVAKVMEENTQQGWLKNAPEQDYSGFLGALDYYVSGGHADGYSYDRNGKAIGFSPVMGEAPVPSIGKVVKLAKNAKKVVVIGENMVERVIPYAKKYGYKYFQPIGKNAEKWMRNQKQWIYRQIKDDKTTIIDIGPAGKNSPWYKEELKMLKKWLGYGGY